MLKIFLKMKGQYIKTEMEYPVNFWLMLLSGILTRTLAAAVPFVIYKNIPGIAGWSEEEIYLIMCFLFIAEGLCSILFEGIWMMPEMVFGGQFDMILARPVSPLFQVLSYGMGLQGIGVFIFGIIGLAVSLARLGYLRPLSVLLCLFFVFCGTLICMSVYLLSSSVVFWFDSGGRTSIPYTVSSIGQYAKYPVTIYPAGIRFLLLLVIPYAFIGMVPVMILRGEHVLLYSLALAGICAVFFLLARFVFYRGIANYESMGM